MPHSQRVKHRLRLLKENPICFWCGKQFEIKKYTEFQDFATLEHIIPRYLGGSDSERNLRLACFKCNK